MPGFYADGEYDIAGFIVGAVERARLIDGKAIAPGDLLIGLRSSGLHTNGYSLARKVFFDRCGLAVTSQVDELGGTVGDVLLATHRSYLRPVTPLLQEGLVKGMAHITGGGITENLPRVLPDGCAASIDRRSWAVPPLFTFIAERGGIATDEMFRAFNMGIGLIVVCDRGAGDRVPRMLDDAGETGATIVGEIVAGGDGVSTRRESAARHPHLGTRIEPAVDRRRDRAGRSARVDRGRDLESSRGGGAAARAKRVSRRSACVRRISTGATPTTRRSRRSCGNGM